MGFESLYGPLRLVSSVLSRGDELIFHVVCSDALFHCRCWGLYSLVCPWTGHILAGTRFLKLKRIFLGSRREAISPLVFTHKFGERRIAIKVLTKRVTPNRFGPAGPIDTSVRQRTNTSIGTGPSRFLQHALGFPQQHPQRDTYTLGWSSDCHRSVPCAYAALFKVLCPSHSRRDACHLWNANPKDFC